MGVVLVSVHPPLMLAPAAVDSTVAVNLRQCLHAALWLSVAIDEWQVRRSGHLHLIREPDQVDWREVDLARHPLRPAPLGYETSPVELEQELRRGLARMPLQLYRMAGIGLVSEIGEGMDDFRRRATGLLRPELQRRIATIVGEPVDGAHVPRGDADRRQVDEKGRLAAELAGIAGSIEAIELLDATEHIRRAQVGLLLVAPGVRLETPRHRALMI